MKKSLSLTISVAVVLSGMALAAEKPPDPKLARLETLLKQVQSEPGRTQEAQVRELLGLAKQLGRPYSASLAIRGFLSHNFRPSPALLLATAEAAYSAGDYTYAVARYKAYLPAAGPSQEAGRAAAVLYTLLIDFLGAEEDAYQFMSKHGDKFRTVPAARRFDYWFLGEPTCGTTMPPRQSCWPPPWPTRCPSSRSGCTTIRTSTG